MIHRPPLLALLAGLLAPHASHATLIYGLTFSNELISFDSATPGVTSTIGVISQPGIVDIDFYPVNGLLYGMTGAGGLYRINRSTGAAVLAATPLADMSTVTDIDFNPSADRLRVFSSGDRNFRLVPDVNNSNPGTPGTVVTDGTFSNPGFDLVGNAYTNNFDGVASTTLYSIDDVGDQLIIHSVGPTFNTITAVGPLGVAIGANVGFDVGQDGVAYLTNDNSFYSLNLASGTASSLGSVGGTGLTSIAAYAVPEAGTLSGVVLLAGLALAWRRRRE